MKEVLFVCYGNVGRSQMAEAFYNDIARTDSSWSAGIQEDTPARYVHPAPVIVSCMREVGIDISQAKVKTITQHMVDESKRVIVLCAKEQCPEYLLASEHVTFWDIHDPFEMTIEKTREVRDVIRDNVSALLGKL